MKTPTEEKLFIKGGPKLRNKPMPFREQFGKKELNAVINVFKKSWKDKRDFSSEGFFENKFNKEFSKFHGGGFVDTVNSGTSAVYIALKSYGIKKKDEVIISPVCNPGGTMPIALASSNLVIPDSAKNSFIICPENFAKSVNKNTKFAVITHLGGHSVEIEEISKICKKNKIILIEDCSQAHGAKYKNKYLGTFGDTSTWSTMFSKTLSTGGTGGVILTKKKDQYWKIRSIADRGKPFNKKNFNFRNTDEYLFPSLNYNIDELSCAIGSSILSRLKYIIKKRQELATKLDQKLISLNGFSPTNLQIKNSNSSIFFHTIKINLEKFKSSKEEIVKAIESEGIEINGNYKDIVCEWKWINKYTKKKYYSENAINFRNSTFNLLYNEKYTLKDIQDIFNVLKKVEHNLIKN